MKTYAKKVSCCDQVMTGKIICYKIVFMLLDTVEIEFRLKIIHHYSDCVIMMPHNMDTALPGQQYQRFA